MVAGVDEHREVRGVHRSLEQQPVVREVLHAAVDVAIPLFLSHAVTVDVLQLQSPLPPPHAAHHAPYQILFTNCLHHPPQIGRQPSQLPQLVALQQQRESPSPASASPG